jgi:hypothetical protein
MSHTNYTAEQMLQQQRANREAADARRAEEHQAHEALGGGHVGGRPGRESGGSWVYERRRD